ncbi:hypothetical protein BDK51DRAFT_5893, partial [Blyttiomyces helicus]
LTPCPGAIRALVFQMAARYHVLPKTRGSGKRKILTIFRTGRSFVPLDWEQIADDVAEKNGERLKGNLSRAGPTAARAPKRGKVPGAPDQAAKPKIGTIVGQNAAPIGETNVGHRMLLAMGWSVGSSLGVQSSASATPIEVVIRGKRTGLG